MKTYKDLLARLNIEPHELGWYELAFTHPSKNGDRNLHHHDYERLEFIGDAVIGLVVAELTFRRRGDLSQGMMSKMRSQLVQSKSLAKHARRLQFEQYIITGASLNGVISDRILEDVFEAFSGALFLDQGYEFTHQFLTDAFSKEVIFFDTKKVNDYKSTLQEEMQAEHRQSIQYVLITSEGPSHAPTFTVEARFNETILGTGVGSSKKAAEQAAAKDALSRKATVKIDGSI